MKQLRRTMLFVPGNNPGMIKDAGIYSQDCIMFDLEDSVSLTEKDAARFLVYQALCSMDFRGGCAVLPGDHRPDRAGKWHCRRLHPDDGGH